MKMKTQIIILFSLILLLGLVSTAPLRVPFSQLESHVEAAAQEYEALVNMFLSEPYVSREHLASVNSLEDMPASLKAAVLHYLLGERGTGPILNHPKDSDNLDVDANLRDIVQLQGYEE